MAARQFGSDTQITTRCRLILCDCYETLVTLDLDGSRYIPRRGVLTFLQHFAIGRHIPVVVVSDALLEQVQETLAEAGIHRLLTTVYAAPRYLESLSDGRSRKRLDLVLEQHGMAVDEVVFIGDSRFDAEAATHHRVPFIRVPGAEDREFSFERLISGASMYSSGEFSEKFLDSLRQPT